MGRLTNLKPRLQTAPARLATMKPNSWRNDKQTSGDRGYTYKWQKAREAWLAKHPLCVFCDSHGLTVRATVLDHKVPHRGDMTLFWDSKNWQGLCAPCHSGEKQRQERAAAGL